jgi:hypothetical protein
MLRDNGAWCRLEAEGEFTVHVGWDQYLYLSSSRPCEAALTRSRALGLFTQRLDASPYDFAPDDPAYVQRPADADFWARLGWTVSAHRATFLEETFALNASRWHRLSRDNIKTVRSQLTPRAQLSVWPDLLTDVDTAVAALPDEGLVEIIWEKEDGQITSAVVDEAQFEDVTSQLASASAAGVVSMYAGEDLPLFTAVLPDSDGVLRTGPADRSSGHGVERGGDLRYQGLVGRARQVPAVGVERGRPEPVGHRPHLDRRTAMRRDQLGQHCGVLLDQRVDLAGVERPVRASHARRHEGDPPTPAFQLSGHVLSEEVWRARVVGMAVATPDRQHDRVIRRRIPIADLAA